MPPTRSLISPVIHPLPLCVPWRFKILFSSTHDGPRVIYAAAYRLGAPRLQRERIVFKQTPYVLDL